MDSVFNPACRVFQAVTHQYTSYAFKLYHFGPVIISVTCLNIVQATHMYHRNLKYAQLSQNFSKDSPKI